MILSWDEYFMSVALLSSYRSKDPSTKVGATIVNPHNRIVGIGYNGFPYGCSDEIFPWQAEGEFLAKKNTYVVHAELNAILNAPTSVRGCRLYVTLFPCNECTKAIIQSGISEIIYLKDKYQNNPIGQASRLMLEAAQVSYRQLSVNKDIVLELLKSE